LIGYCRYARNSAISCLDRIKRLAIIERNIHIKRAIQTGRVSAAQETFQGIHEVACVGAERGQWASGGLVGSSTESTDGGLRYYEFMVDHVDEMTTWLLSLIDG